MANKQIEFPPEQTNDRRVASVHARPVRRVHHHRRRASSRRRGRVVHRALVGRGRKEF